MARPTRSVLLVLLAAPLAASAAAAGGTTPLVWSGFYIGLHGGGALGLVDVADPYAPPIFGDTVRTPGPLAGGQLGYDWQIGQAVLGLEADMSWADMDGTNTCFAHSGTFVSSNCAAHIDAMGTVAARLGWVLPSDGSTLVYGKAGLATAHTETDATPGGGLGLEGTGAHTWHWGWTLGLGMERAIAPRWTARVEYDVLAFDDIGFTAPASRIETTPAGPLADTPARATDLSQDIHRFKIGMNYRFGPGATSRGEAGHVQEGNGPASGTELKAGVRYVYGWAQFHKDLGVTGLASLASRLTYDSPGIDGAEAFARIDTPFGLMVKGLVGGARGEGELTDEDWAIPFAVFIPYSNTLSAVDDRIRYWTVDVGYAGWRGATHTIAPFVGYGHLHQSMTGYGCRQIANPSSDCNPAIPASVRVITEDDTWRALRLGTAVDVALAPRLTLAAEAAWLPYVDFSGTDDHVLRSLVSPESGEGTGMQIEAMLSYALTDAWSIGVGGRYWSMWTTSGNVDFGGTGEIVPMRYAAEQAHVLVQGSYRFGTAPDP